jgi:hypothetical protein
MNEPGNVDNLMLRWVQAVKRAVRGMLKHWIILGVLVATAFGLIILRGWALRTIPFLQRHLKASSITINTVADAFIILEDVVKEVVHIIQKFKALFGGASPPPVKMTPLLHLDDNEVQAMLTELVSAAARYNTGPKACHFLLRFFLNSAVCPVVRAATPTLLGGTVSTFLGWLTFHPDPNFGVHSCQCQLEFETIHVAAAVAGVGLVILEIVLPTYLGIILLYCIIPPTASTVVVLHEMIVSFPGRTLGF